MPGVLTLPFKANKDCLEKEQRTKRLIGNELTIEVEQQTVSPSKQPRSDDRNHNTDNNAGGNSPSGGVGSQPHPEDLLFNNEEGPFPTTDEDWELSELSSSESEPPFLHERDPPMPPHWLREQGSRVLRWIENAGEPACPIPQHTPCFSQIVQEAEVRVGENREFPSELREIPVIPGAAPDKPPCTFFSATYNQGLCNGITAPGVMIIENISRHRIVTTDQPHSTEIALAFYSRDYPLESLRHVFVTGIMNTQTRDYLENHLYSKLWPRDSNGFQRASSEYQDLVRTQIWENGSEEFETLMGTRIGRTVAYLVLGGFPRGTRRIARIFVYVVHVWNYHFEFRFDIEPITHPASTDCV